MENKTYLKLIALLDRNKAKYRLIDHAPEGRTEIVSPMRGNKLSQAAKCMVLVVNISKTEKKYVLGVFPGDKQLDFDAVKTVMHASYVSFAPKELTEELAQSVVGTVLPFSFNTELELIVDPLLLNNEEIFFNAARLDQSMALKTSDYVSIVKPRLAEIAKSSDSHDKKPSLEDNLFKLRHSTAHLLAAAVLELYPQAKPTIGPPIDTGFYYDFDDLKISEEDLEKIEQKMHELLKTWGKFELVDGQPANEYKKEIADELKRNGEKITYFKSGNFVDLCAGPHIDDVKELGHFKLLKLAGAYWRGSEKNKMLTRVYGTAFFSQKDLDAYLLFQEEIKKRDHRKIGKDLELFTFAEEIGPGLPLWLPKGEIIRDELENWGKETEKKWGYQRVGTPFLTKRKLFEISAHVPYFEDEMYKVEVPGDNKDEQYYIKPMNCPFHHMIYKNRTRSYKELPLRLAEYGTVARYEESGTLNGILRPRLFCQNDAHVYCTQEQAIDEFVAIINLHKYYYDTLGLKDYYIVLALRDPKKKDKYHGEEELWQESEKISIAAMEKAGITYRIENEGAAHYGPKMDFKIKSAIGTEYGISTNQIDLFMPRRFDLKYVDKDGQEKFVVVQHRAPLGSSERFVGFLLENFAGNLPTWLSPVQVKILPIADRHLEYAKSVASALQSADIRVETDERSEKLGAKIRDAQMQKIPYMLILGDKEQEVGKIAVRTRSGKDLGSIELQNFLENIKIEIKEKRIV